MATEVNVSLINDSYVPNLPLVMIESIVLDQASTMKKTKQDPHIQSQEEVAATTIQDYNNSVAATPMKTRLNMFVLHPVDSGISAKNSFLFNSELSDLIKVYVVQSRHPTATSNITENYSAHLNPVGGTVFNSGDDANYIVKTFTSYGVISLSQWIAAKYPNISQALQSENGFSTTYDLGIQTDLPFDKITLTNGKDYYKIPINITFEIPVSQGGIQADHLTYFAYCGIDTGALQTKLSLSGVDLSISLNVSNNLIEKMSMSQPTYELVLDGGAVQNEATVYIKQSDGSLFFGPKHQMPDGSWMMGNSHSPGNNAGTKLIEQKVPNYKILDYRQKISLESMNFDFNSVFDYIVPNQTLVDLLKNTNTQELLKVKNTSFISDLKMARDINGSCRFMFHVNMHEVALRNTIFPDFLLSLKQSSEEEYSSLLKGFSIRSLKIIRNRVKRKQVISNQSENAIVSKYDYPVLVALSQDNTNGKLASSTYEDGNFYSSASNKSKGKRSEVSPDVFKDSGGISEIKIKNFFSDTINKYNPVRTFSVVDFGVGRNNAGVYQYSIEMEFVDPVLEYFKSKYTILNNAMLQLETLISDLSKPSYSDLYNDRFNTKANEHYLANYPPNYLPNIILDFLNVVYLTAPDSSSLLAAAYMQMQFLNNISNTQTGSIDGLIFLHKLMNDFASKMDKLINMSLSYQKGVHLKTGSTLETQVNQSAGYNEGEQKYFKLKHTFKKLYDIENKINYGYDFISNTEQQALNGTEFASLGLKIFDQQEIKKRFQSETEKLFNVGTNGNASLEFTVDGSSQNVKLENILNPGDTITNKKFSFLSPSMIMLPRQRVFNSIQNSAIGKNKKYAELVIDIFNLNQRGMGYVDAKNINIKSRKMLEDIDKVEQQKRIELASLLADKGCTVETTKQANINQGKKADYTTNPFDPGSSQNANNGFAGSDNIDKSLFEELELNNQSELLKEDILDTSINTNRLMGSMLMIDDFGMLKKYFTDLGPVYEGILFYNLSDQNGGLTFKNEFLNKKYDPRLDALGVAGSTFSIISQSGKSIIESVKGGILYTYDNTTSALAQSSGVTFVRNAGINVGQRNKSLTKSRGFRPAVTPRAPSGRFASNVSNTVGATGTQPFMPPPSQVSYTNNNGESVIDLVADLVADAANVNLGLIPNEKPLSQAPNHVKSLLSVFNKTGMDPKENMVTRAFKESSNPFADYESKSFIIFNYKMINRIEVFRGFGGDNEKVQDPIFSDLKEEDLQSTGYGSLGELLLCRQKKYVKETYAVESYDHLNMPLMDEYFLVQPLVTSNNPLLPPPPGIKATLSQAKDALTALGSSGLQLGYNATLAAGQVSTVQPQANPFRADSQSLTDLDMQAMRSVLGGISPPNRSGPKTAVSKYENLSQDDANRVQQTRRLNSSEPPISQRGRGRGGY